MEEILFGQPDMADVLVEALWKVPGWPKDRDRDREFAHQLIREFPTMHLPNAVQDWQTWLLDHPEVGATGKKKVNWRSRFRTWCKNGVRYAQDRRERQGSGAAGRRVGGVAGPDRTYAARSSRPGTAAEFGDTRRLDDW